MRVRDVVVAGILARRQDSTQSMPFIHRPGHYQHVGLGQWAAAISLRRFPGFRGKRFRPWNVRESRQARRRRESKEFSALRRLGVEINNLSLKVFRAATRLRRLRKSKG